MQPSTPVPVHKNKTKFLILILVLILAWWLGNSVRIDTQGLKASLASLPVILSAAVFITIYVVLTFFIWFSKDILRVIAAILFGAYFSTLFVVIAETINAFILFGLARTLGRGFVEKNLSGKALSLDQRLGQMNFLWLFLLRTTPLVPFRFLDLACGLTKIPFRKYLAAVVLGSWVRVFWVQYPLAAVGQAVFERPAALSEFMAKNSTFFWASLAYLGLVIVVALKLKRKD
jgi:uncharacterized membrane protein YdjX (TVP38/TMEM64 family)